MLLPLKNGQASVVLRAKLRNSSVSTGAGLTGLTFSSTGLIISTIADNEATATAYTVAASKVETIATLGIYAAPTATKCRFKEVDAVNHPGLYEFQFADARFAVANAKSMTVTLSGATNLAECDFVIPLQTVDPYVVGGTAPVDVQTIKGQTITCAAGITILPSVGTATVSTAQSGDSYARIGTTGAGLTTLGDPRLANLDVTVGSRSTFNPAGAVPFRAQDSVTAPTYNDCFQGAWSDSYGAELENDASASLIKYAPDKSTPYRTFVLNINASGDPVGRQ